MSLEITDKWRDISAKNVVLRSCIIAEWDIYIKVKSVAICRKAGTVREIRLCLHGLVISASESTKHF